MKPYEARKLLEHEQIQKLLKAAGFVQFEPDEDRGSVIDWSSDYDRELAAFIKLVITHCCSKITNIDLVHELEQDFGLRAVPVDLDELAQRAVANSGSESSIHILNVLDNDFLREYTRVILAESHKIMLEHDYHADYLHNAVLERFQLDAESTDSDYDKLEGVTEPVAGLELSPRQIRRLAELEQQGRKGLNRAYKIEVRHGSGIGPSVQVQVISPDNKTVLETLDITDYDSW